MQVAEPLSRSPKASAAATRAYGYTREELLSMSLRDLIAADQLGDFDEFYRAQTLVEAPGLLPRNRRRHRRGLRTPAAGEAPGAA